MPTRAPDVGRFLLDTTALIDFSKNREPARSRLMAMIEDGDELGVCSIQVAEFWAGLPLAERARWSAFIDHLRYWDILRETAERAGEYRHDFARRGQAISTADALIAAVARQEHAVIVTDNAKDFPMMEGVTILTLRP